MFARNNLLWLNYRQQKKGSIMEMLTELCLLRELVYHISSQGMTVRLSISEKQDLQRQKLCSRWYAYGHIGKSNCNNQKKVGCCCSKSLAKFPCFLKRWGTDVHNAMHTHFCRYYSQHPTVPWSWISTAAVRLLVSHKEVLLPRQVAYEGLMLRGIAGKAEMVTKTSTSIFKNTGKSMSV